jgi:hypothetical protein
MRLSEGPTSLRHLSDIASTLTEIDTVLGGLYRRAEG